MLARATHDCTVQEDDTKEYSTLQHEFSAVLEEANELNSDIAQLMRKYAFGEAIMRHYHALFRSSNMQDCRELYRSVIVAQSELGSERSYGE